MIVRCAYFSSTKSIAKLFHRCNRDSVQLFLPEYRQDLPVQARSKVENVRRPAIQLATEPFLGNVAERRDFRWLNVLAARSLLQGISLELLGLFAGFEANASTWAEQAERAIIKDPLAVTIFAAATGYVEFPMLAIGVRTTRLA